MHAKEELLSNALRLVRGGRALGVPFIWAEQNPKGLGSTVPELAALLTDVTPISKFTFNCCDSEARVLMDVYYEDREPVLGIALAVPARRVKCFRMDHPAEIGGLVVRRLEQYALRFRSDIEVIVQYGRMDIAQDNLAYIGMMGHAG